VAGALAIILLPVFLWVIEWLGTYAGLDAGATSLAAFHTLFIAVGVILFLPFVSRFAQLVERLLPERGEVVTQRLDASLLSIPAVALEASQRALEQVAQRLLTVYSEMLSGQDTDTHEQRLQQAAPLLNEIYDFVSRVELPAGDAVAGAQRIAQLHAIDHLLRFRTRLHDLTRADIDLAEPDYGWALQNSRRILQLAQDGLAQGNLQTHLGQLEADAMELAGLSKQVRHELLRETASGPVSSANALKRTDTYRWLERTANHIWRVCHYLAQGRRANGAPPAPEPP
jgi:phosphate:Na+ symporter